MEVHQIAGIVGMVLLFAFLFFFIRSTINKSKKFYDGANKLEDKIQHANTVIELEKLYEEDFKNLQKLSLGEPHSTKLGVLFGMLKGKISGLKS